MQLSRVAKKAERKHGLRSSGSITLERRRIRSAPCSQCSHTGLLYVGSH